MRLTSVDRKCIFLGGSPQLSDGRVALCTAGATNFAIRRNGNWPPLRYLLRYPACTGGIHGFSTAGLFTEGTSKMVKGSSIVVRRRTTGSGTTSDPQNVESDL